MNDEVKAYDAKVLLEKLKEEGLEIAEDGAAALVTVLLDWVAAEAPKSKTPYDDMALVIIPPLKKFILEQIDKIDGEEG